MSKVPSGWRNVSVGDICEFKYGKSLPASSRLPGGHPVYGSNGIVGSHNVPLTSGPTIVIGRKGSLGEVAYSPGPCWPIDTTYFVDSTSTAEDLRWLSRRLSALGLTELNRAAAVPGLNREDAYRKRLLLPPIEEQRRIAEVLDRADELRAKRREALAHLDNLTQSILLDMFGEPFTNERGWTSYTVGDAGKVQLGRQRAPQYQTGTFARPYLRVANVYEDRIDLSDVLQMDFDEGDFENYRLHDGDILLNEGQSTELVGRPAMWRGEAAGFCYQNTLVRFQAHRSIVDPTYALAVFLRYFRTGQLSKISSKTSNVAHLGAGRFAKMPFPVPPLELQKVFVARADAIRDLKDRQETSLAESDALFASLQDLAFRGGL